MEALYALSMQWTHRLLVISVVSCLGCEASDPEAGVSAGGTGVPDVSGGTGGQGGAPDRSFGGIIDSEGEFDPIPLEGLTPCAERPVFCEAGDTSADVATEHLLEIGEDCVIAMNFPCGAGIAVKFDERGCAVGTQDPDIDARAMSCFIEAITAERWACAAGMIVRAGAWTCE
ncbi:hypothetical protein [Sorangium sp. So ce693]|uniref:hypothetical protein n=1 Tax=Sorangium sp. So ce693 TaxID=3133318 RepID=UPI003F5EDB81